MLIAFMVLPRLIQGFGVFETLKRLGSRLLRPGRIPVENFLFGLFVRLGGGLMAPKIASIYFLDLEWKVEGGFGFCSDGFLNDLFPGVLLTAILLSQSKDKKAQAVAKQADQDQIRDHCINIEFSENG